MKIDNIDQVVQLLKRKLPDYVASIIGHNPGKNGFHCLNPNHNDQSPSAYLNPHEDFTIGRCFGCNVSFDIFNLASWQEGLPTSGMGFIDTTIRTLADRYNIQLVESDFSPADKELYSTLRTIRLVSELVASGELGEWSTDIEAYISERGWTKQALSALGIGVISKSGLLTRMEALGYTPEYLHSINLLQLGNGEDSFSVLDSEKLVFTIFDENGRGVGFASRNFGSGTKFTNSPTDKFGLYEKGKILYGLNWAKKNKKKPLYIFEGYGDVITAHLKGLTNSVCVGGTCLTQDQVLKIQESGFQSIILAFDWDEAGQLATDRALDNALQGIRDLSVKVLLPSNEKDDPDSFIRREGIEAFLSLPTISSFSWALHKKREQGVAGTELANGMLPFLVAEPSAINREQFIKELSLASSISYHSIETEVSKRSNIAVEHRRQAQNAIVQRLAKDIDSDPVGAVTVGHAALQALEELSKEYDSDKVTNSSFISLVEKQRILEEHKAEDNTQIGLITSLLPSLQTRLSGGDDYTTGCLFLLGGEENTGKSSFLSYWGLNIAAELDNDAIVIMYSIDDTGPQILPKLICAADAFINKGYKKDSPLTIGHIKSLRSITDQDLLLRRAEAYDFVTSLGQEDRLVLKDAKDGNTLSYLESVIRYYRRRYPSRKIVITVDNTHNLADFAYMEDRTERYKRIANTQKAIVNRYDAMMFATVEYRKGDQREKADIQRMMPTNNEIAETRALKYLASFIGHLYNDIHSRPNIYDTFHVCPQTGMHLPRIFLNVGKTKFNGFKGTMSYDFFPGSSAFVDVSNEAVKLERTRYLKTKNTEEDEEEEW